MKILVGISGASGVELSFCLLAALEKYAQKNDEIYAILSEGAKVSFWAENLASNGENSAAARHCERDEVEAWQSINLKKTSILKAKNSINLNSTNSTQNSQISAPNTEKFINLSQIPPPNDEILTFCQKKFALKKTHFFDDNNLAAAVSSGSFGIDKTIIAPCSTSTLAKIKAGFADTLILRAAAVALKERKTLVLGVREIPFSTLALKQMAKLSKMGALIAPPVYASYFGARNLGDLQGFIVGKWLDLLGIEHKLYKKWRGVKKRASQ